MKATTASLDRRERGLARGLSVAPYLLLVLSTALALLTGDHGGVDQIAILVGLAGLAAAWMATVGRRPSLSPVYVTGLIVLIAALCSRDIWFASFFAFVGYLHSWQRLRGIWRFVGVTLTATVAITAFMGGFPEPTFADIAAYVLFIVALVSVVSLFSVVGDVTAERSAEHKRMVTQLEETLRENVGLQAQLLVQAREAGVTDERQRMAREIHDTIAQGLAGIITQLQVAEGTGQGPNDAEWRPRVQTALRLARENLVEARRSVHAVGPAELDSAQLPEAIAAVATRWGEQNGVQIEVGVHGRVRPLHPEVEVTLLRIAQEALTNAAKHAGATRVGVNLAYMEREVTLDVRDDGVGFDLERASTGGFGLRSMRQRLDRVAGTLKVETEPGAGTAVSVIVPAVSREDARA